MSDPHPPLHDPALGDLHRATSELTDGTVLTHDWYVGSTPVEGSTLELMLEGTTPAEVEPLLPRLRDTVDRLSTLRRLATDAVVTRFSTGEPEPHELTDAATDLQLETLEAASDGTVVLHFTDTCAQHFPEGYWPAVHLGPDDAVLDVTVES